MSENVGMSDPAILFPVVMKSLRKSFQGALSVSFGYVGQELVLTNPSEWSYHPSYRSAQQTDHGIDPVECASNGESEEVYDHVCA